MISVNALSSRDPFASGGKVTSIGASASFMARDLQQSDRLRDQEDEAIEPPQIRRFRRLVSLLMVVMMVGILAIAAALVWRLTQSEDRPVSVAVAREIAVDEGWQVVSVSRAGVILYLLVENAETGERMIEERRASDQSLIGQFKLVAADTK